MNINRGRRHPNTVKMEAGILQFLYDDGPQISTAIADHVQQSVHTVSKMLTDLKHEGVLEHSKLRKGDPNVYWIYPEHVPSPEELGRAAA
jgi:predicted ArsR family transcriptional regulator